VITCPKCGLVQDEEKPVCVHMVGRKGGLRRLEKHGRESMSEMGKRGGASLAAKYGRAHFSAIGSQKRGRKAATVLADAFKK